MVLGVRGWDWVSARVGHQAAFEWAQAQKVKVIPSCTYLSDTFLPRHPQFRDVLASKL